MRRLLLRLLINTLGLFVAVVLVPGVAFVGPWWQLALVAAIFGVVNAFLRPLLTLLTCPLVFLTLGFFALVINAFLFWLTASFAESLGIAFTATGFWAAFFGALVVSIVSILVAVLTREPDEVRVIEVRRE